MTIDTLEIARCAMQFRQKYMIQSYGIKDIFGLLAQTDIRLIRFPFGRNTLLGFATWHAGKAVLVSNSSEILTCEIYTIAHELGHFMYDFTDDDHDTKIDRTTTDCPDDLTEKRAYEFADCLLMPMESLDQFIKFELKKKETDQLHVLDLVRIQIEFQVSYTAAVCRLYHLKRITAANQAHLIKEHNEGTSQTLLKYLDADERLLKPTNKLIVPAQYLEYAINNYEYGHIPYASLDNSLSLIDLDAEIFMKDNCELDDDLDPDDS